MTAYRLKKFIDNELKVFSNLDNVRSIPSLIDGFKDSQRKAVFGLIKHGTSEIKVHQLGSFAAMVSQYAHGEVSMCDTIVGLAQNFPGSNNVNLFEPIGQFGSILSSESSAHRYIYTKQSANLRKYIRKEDDIILIPRTEEGDALEPQCYYPIVPMWLVNGSVGIGTGHSVKILPRDPKKVLELIKKLVSGVNVQQRTIDSALTPSFGGWKGEVKEGDSDTQWELHGVVKKVNSTTLRVAELPVTYDVDKFKSILIKLIDEGVVKDFDNNSTEAGFDFEISVPREVGKKDEEELKSIFKLVAKVGENVTLWNASGRLQRFDSVYEALQEFVKLRQTIYKVRQTHKLEELAAELGWLCTKKIFIMHWCTKIKDPHKKNKDELIEAFSPTKISLEDLNRLLTMQISSLTLEKIAELDAEIDKVSNEKAALASRTVEDMYVADLDDV